jgi:hypothetical protein
VALQPFVGPEPLFQILDSIHSWTGDQPVAKPLPTHRTTQTQNKRSQYLHLCLEWHSNPAFELAKTVRALDRAATVIVLNW